MAYSMKKDLKNLISIKEKRTFITRMHCINPICEGEYKYNPDNQFADIFGSILNSQDGHEKTFLHKCTKCGDTKEFIQIYPLITEYEIGICTPTNSIIKFVSTDIHSKMEKDLIKLGIRDE